MRFTYDTDVGSFCTVIEMVHNKNICMKGYKTMAEKPNIIVIMSDTLRSFHLGCYGNKNIKTPNIDAFAKESIIFDNAYPESLPTIPVRRATHTGRRAFPFRNYKPVKWDVVYLPGWQPMDNDEDTLAENLAQAGYYTGFVTDTMPYFAPGFNFNRGFWQWEFIRGKQVDKWRSGVTVTGSQLEKYGDSEEILRKGNDKLILQHTAKHGPPGGIFNVGYDYNLIIRHIANTVDVHSEEDTHAARVFRWAANFIDDNRNAQPLYLLIDCFDPHEPWEAPQSYLEMYADPDYKGKTILLAPYGPIDGKLTSEELENIKANYSGLVTLIDTWFGYFVNKLKKLEMWDNSLIIFTSDHGTNFGEYPDNVIGKPHYSLYPGVMKIPMIINLPGKKALCKRFNNMIYNIDPVATIYEFAGFKEDNLNIDGQSLVPLIYNGKWKDRKYLTCRYNSTLWFKNEKYWIILNIDSEPVAGYDIQADPSCQNNLVNKLSSEVIKMAWENILKDAGGDLPDYRDSNKTDAIGRPV